MSGGQSLQLRVDEVLAHLAQAQAAAQNSGANAIGNPPPADVEPENAKGNALLDAIHKVNGVK